MTSADNWPQSIPVQNQDTAWRIVDDECIIIVPELSQATVLNPVGAYIWELADGKHTMCEIVDSMVKDYDVERAVAESDAREFLEDLIKRGLMSLKQDTQAEEVG